MIARGRKDQSVRIVRIPAGSVAGPPVAALAIVLAMLTLPAASSAQNQQPPAPICQTTSEFRAFDFWVGEWSVFDTTGTQAGQNRIESRENGCVLVEHWTSASGGTGMSMNWFDNVSGKWRQVWVANGYNIDIVGGPDAAGAMVLVGTLHNYRQGQSSDFRGTWTPNQDGSVRQLFEQKDSTGTWQVWFDGKYVRRK